MTSVDSRRVRFSASARREADVLHISFVMENGLGQGIYLCSRAGGLLRDDLPVQRAYVRYLDEPQILHVSLLAPTPRGADYALSAQPLSRYLPADETFRGSFSFALPMEPWTPYPDGPSEDEQALVEALFGSSGQAPKPSDLASPGVEAEPAVVRARLIRFDTGWFPESGLVWREDGPEPETYWCGGRFLRKVVAEIEPPEPIPVRIGRPREEG